MIGVQPDSIMERYRERSSGPTSPAVEGHVRRPAPTVDVVQSASDGLIREWVNTLLAIIALVVLSPVMLLIAFVVKVTSRGPALYTQTRVGLECHHNPGVRHTKLHR